MMALAPDYGRRIRLRRQALGMSQEQLGEAVGASASAVISWESHRHAPTRKQGAIESVLGISLDGDEPEQPDPDEETLMSLDLDPQERAKLIEAYRAIRAQGARRRNSA